MNYPEELREKFNECMFDERDLIMNFLNDTADLSRGNQMFEWTLEPMPKLLGHDGKMYEVREIALDPNKFVTFLTTSGGCKSVWRECTFFAYGELSKIIEMLPETDKFIYSDKLSDIGSLQNDYDIASILRKSPFKYENEVLNDYDGDICSIITALHNNDAKYATAFRDYVRVQILKESEQYKKLKEILSNFEQLAYNFCDNNTFLAVVITPQGTDMQLPVCDVSFEYGQINVLVSINGTRLGDETGEDDMNLTEKDLTPANLQALVDWFEHEARIMDDDNHDRDLVRKINIAWTRDEYRADLGWILLAIARRDYASEIGRVYGDLNMYIQTPEDAITYARAILKDACTNEDLEYILKYIGYKED